MIGDISVAENVYIACEHTDNMAAVQVADGRPSDRTEKSYQACRSG